jgi:3-deoxy-D-manno-octulosonic-acid transferase
MSPLLLNVLYVLAALLYLPFLVYQMVFLKKNRRGWRQRFGGLPRREGAGPCIWIHAVSLGEVNATQSLVVEINKRLPGYDVVISATTDTGYAAARRHYPQRHVVRYPLDFSFAVNRAFDRIRPDAVILLELEAWPNFVTIAARRNIPVGIANGRLTEEKSMRRFGLPVVRSLARQMFSRITWIAAQNEEYAARFRKLGARAENVTVTGTMKYDTALIAERVSGDRELGGAMGIEPEAPLFVAGSTGPGEEEMLLDAYSELRTDFPTLRLAIIPRKPERFAEVARLIEARGHVCLRRSSRPDDAPTTDVGATSQAASAPVILGDTMGELRKFYALADLVFVGRSLVPMGGSDMIEVAALARPMCFGPYTQNFADVAETLLTAKAAVRVGDRADLARVVREFLRDRDAALEMGRRAQDVVRKNRGATQRTVDLLCASLGDGATADNR